MKSKKGKSKSKSKSKSKARKDIKSPGRAAERLTPISGSAFKTPVMTPLHKILRNSIGDAADMSDVMRTRTNRFGSTAQKKRVKI